LALVYEDLGQYADAAQQWQLILNDHPDYHPATHSLSRLPKCEARDDLPVGRLVNSS
jgi:hypothetical protein